MGESTKSLKRPVKTIRSKVSRLNDYKQRVSRLNVYIISGLNSLGHCKNTHICVFFVMWDDLINALKTTVVCTIKLVLSKSFKNNYKNGAIYMFSHAIMKTEINIRGKNNEKERFYCVFRLYFNGTAISSNLGNN